MSIVQSPVFLGTLLFLGLASLIRILISRDPSLKRSDDRRQAKAKMPVTPFLDSDGVEVTEDRRHLPDRRRHRLLAMQENLHRDEVAG